MSPILKNRDALPRLPSAPRSIQKGSTLRDLLDREAIECLVHNLSLAFPDFDGEALRRSAGEGLKPLAILQRGHHLARALRLHLPERYEDAMGILLRSLTPPLSDMEDHGLGGFLLSAACKLTLATSRRIIPR